MHKKSWHPFCTSQLFSSMRPTILRHGALPGVWLIDPVTLYWKKNYFSLSHQESVANSFLIRSEILYNLLFLVLGFYLIWTCVGLMHTNTFPVCMCISIVVSGKCCFPAAIHHYWLLDISQLLFSIDPWALRGGVDKAISSIRGIIYKKIIVW